MMVYGSGDDLKSAWDSAMLLAGYFRIWPTAMPLGARLWQKLVWPVVYIAAVSLRVRWLVDVSVVLALHPVHGSKQASGKTSLGKR